MLMTLAGISGAEPLSVAMLQHIYVKFNLRLVLQEVAGRAHQGLLAGAADM